MAGLDYEFAPIDVGIMTHPKACAAGPEAMGLWLWGQTYAKYHGTTGRLHRVAVLTAWGGKRNIILAKRLVDAGLWLAREDGDWDVHNFEAKAAGRPTSSTERMRRLRDKRKGDAGDVTCDGENVTGDANSVTSCSTSPSTSLSGSDLKGDARGARVLVMDEPLTERRRKDFEGLTQSVPERPIAPDWSHFVDDRIKRSVLFVSESAIDADWRQWVRRENNFAAERRKNQRGKPERQPLGDPNAKWLKTGSDL